MVGKPAVSQEAQRSGCSVMGPIECPSRQGRWQWQPRDWGAKLPGAEEWGTLCGG